MNGYDNGEEAGLLLIRLRRFLLDTTAGQLETPSDRQDLFVATGLLRLAKKVYKAGSPEAFASNLLYIIAGDSQDTLLTFLTNYKQKVGLGEGLQGNLNALIDEIAGLSAEQWQETFQYAGEPLLHGYRGDQGGQFTAENVAELLQALQKKDLPQGWTGRIPYLGLDTYEGNDAEFFFGREAQVKDLLNRIQKARFIIITGSSGSGKSSLARAGLFPALQKGRVERSDTWLLATMQPGSNPLEQLALSIDRLKGQPGAADYICQKGLEDPLALHTQVEALLDDDKRRRFVLLVDQFEEVFTQTKNEDEREAFFEFAFHGRRG